MTTKDVIQGVLTSIILLKKLDNNQCRISDYFTTDAFLSRCQVVQAKTEMRQKSVHMHMGVESFLLQHHNTQVQYVIAARDIMRKGYPVQILGK